MKTTIAIVIIAIVLSLPMVAKADYFQLTVCKMCDVGRTCATYKDRSLVRARRWQAIFRKDKKYIATWIKRVK